MIAIDVDVASGERAYHIAYEDTTLRGKVWDSGALHVSKGWGRMRDSVINMGMIHLLIGNICLHGDLFSAFCSGGRMVMKSI